MDKQNGLESDDLETAAAPACCDSVLLDACCGPDVKPTCCGPVATPTKCGCGPERPERLNQVAAQRD